MRLFWRITGTADRCAAVSSVGLSEMIWTSFMELRLWGAPLPADWMMGKQRK